MRKLTFVLASLISFTSLTYAQINAPSSGSATPQSSPAAPMSYANSQSLAELERVAQNTVTDLGHVRVDRWRLSGRDKDDARSNSESLQRNLTAALPSLIQQVRANPASVAASIKLYRNLNAVYDVLASFSESAGAFGSKDDYSALAGDAASFDRIRRNLADQLEQMAANQDALVTRLTEQAKTQAAPAPSSSPKRVVVDDNAPAKKSTSTKKKPATPASNPQ
jgi:hypothetical protein